MSKKTVRKDPGSRKASPKKTKGLIAKAKNAGQSEQEECALDNRSHRTPRGLPDRPKAGTRSRPHVQPRIRS